PLAHTVDDEPGQRREERGEDEHEEDEPCGRVAVREVLGPDPEHEEHRRVPEHGQAPAEEEDARVADAQELAHYVPECCRVTAVASASSGSRSRSSSTGAGISRSARTGENSTG